MRRVIAHARRNFAEPLTIEVEIIARDVRATEIQHEHVAQPLRRLGISGCCTDERA